MWSLCTEHFGGLNQAISACIAASLSLHIPVLGEEIVEDPQCGLEVTVDNVWGDTNDLNMTEVCNEVFISI